MKTCAKCQKEKDDDDFRRNAGAYDGRDHYCKVCRKEYMTEWKKENRERYLALRKGYRDNYKAEWIEVLKGAWPALLGQEFGELECRDCGYSDHVELLEWHHLAGKEEAPNRIFARKLTPERLAEVLTCIPLCPTCHRSRHQYGEPTPPPEAV